MGSNYNRAGRKLVCSMLPCSCAWIGLCAALARGESVVRAVRCVVQQLHT